VFLEGSILRNGKACRTPDYYVDPNSSEMLELGTLEYPYRTMKSATSEILNFLSNNHLNVTIHTYSAYLEDGMNVFINMTNVAFKSHPDVINTGERSILIFTQIAQHGINERALYHLLTSTDFPVQDILTTGLIPDDLQSLALVNDGTSIVSVMTGISFEDINLYREEIDAGQDITLLNTIYLQHLTYEFSKPSLIFSDFKNFV
jgi:hypothetical protein